MNPERMPASSAPWPRVAETVSACWGTSSIGREPKRSATASASASSWVKSPLIWTWSRVKLATLIEGAESTSSSNTMPSRPRPSADCAGHSGAPLKHTEAIALKSSMPGEPALNDGLTVHWPV